MVDISLVRYYFVFSNTAIYWTCLLLLCHCRRRNLSSCERMCLWLCERMCLWLSHCLMLYFQSWKPSWKTIMMNDELSLNGALHSSFTHYNPSLVLIDTIDTHWLLLLFLCALRASIFGLPKNWKRRHSCPRLTWQCTIVPPTYLTAQAETKTTTS